jgi:hypothetical protein
VVDLGRSVKRLPQPLALSIGPHRRQYRDPWSGVGPRCSPGEQPVAPSWGRTMKKWFLLRE